MEETGHQLKEFDFIIEKQVAKLDHHHHQEAAAAPARSGIGCVKHPYHHHHQRQGVCASCLREKLSQLHDTYNLVASSNLMVAPPSSSSSSYSNLRSNSSSALGRVSPSHSRRHRRNVSHVFGSISFRLGGGDGGLKKSRSIAFASRNLAGGEVKNGGSGKKGFWSKLRHQLKGKKEEVFVHSIQVN